MDEELTLHELGRLEAQRKLRAIPERALKTAWVREAQIDAVVDAVLAVTADADARAYSHARHMGEWCARIAAGVPHGPDSSSARRVGALHAVEPSALERIPELRHLAKHVRDYRRGESGEPVNRCLMSLIVSAAEEFDNRLSSDENGHCASPQLALRSMLARADERSRVVVQALMKAVRSENVPTESTACSH
jgi:hypothetical protein